MQMQLERILQPGPVTFRSLGERFSALAAREGLVAKACNPEGPVHFERLALPQQARVLDTLKQYVEVAEETVREGWGLREDRHFLWRMFRRMGVHPTSDWLDYINDGDVIEIYGPDYIQLFRSASFFDNCSYTLDDILARPFWELYRRHDILTEALINAAEGSFRGGRSSVYKFDIGWHHVEEICSSSRYVFNVEYKHMAPLFDSHGSIAAVVTTCRTLGRQSGVN